MQNNKRVIHTSGIAGMLVKLVTYCKLEASKQKVFSLLCCLLKRSLWPSNESGGKSKKKE